MGGGLYAGGTVTVQNSTVTRNQGGSTVLARPVPLRVGGGGGIAVVGTVTLHNTIVADNIHGDDSSFLGTRDDIQGSVDAASTNNLIGTGGSGGLTNGTAATWSAWPTRCSAR